MTYLIIFFIIAVIISAVRYSKNVTKDNFFEDILSTILVFSIVIGFIFVWAGINVKASSKKTFLKENISTEIREGGSFVVINGVQYDKGFFDFQCVETKPYVVIVEYRIKSTFISRAVWLDNCLISAKVKVFLQKEVRK